MLRYRYANTSPKRQDWEGAPGFRQGPHSRNLDTRRPVKRRHLPIVATVRWADPESNATLSADLFSDNGRFVNHNAHVLPNSAVGTKSVSFWKASIAAMVEADKEAVGEWARKASVTLPGDKYLASERRRFNAMVGTDAEWYAYTERRRKAKH